MELRVLREKNQIKEIYKGVTLHLRIPNLNVFELHEESDIIQGLQKGVYALVNENDVFYIGKSIHINERMKAQRRKYNITCFLFYPCKSEMDMAIYEAILIGIYKPIKNEMAISELRQAVPWIKDEYSCPFPVRK